MRATPTMGAGTDVQNHVLRDHDGFIEELYHLLWRKNVAGLPCADILLPDIVIYKYRIPAYWCAHPARTRAGRRALRSWRRRYFMGTDGRLKRKNKSSIVNKRIYDEFTKHAKAPTEVVAYHVKEDHESGDASRGARSVTS